MTWCWAETGASKAQAARQPDFHVQGSENLIQTLLKHDLVNELWVKIFPITLGMGKRLFAERTLPAAFTLREAKTSSRGVIVASYERREMFRQDHFPDRERSIRSFLACGDWLALAPQTSEEQPNHCHLDQWFAGLGFPLVIFTPPFLQHSPQACISGKLAQAQLLSKPPQHNE